MTAWRTTQTSESTPKLLSATVTVTHDAVSVITFMHLFEMVEHVGRNEVQIV